MKPIKIVFDTNVYLAACKRNSYAATHLKRSMPNGPYQLFISPEIIVELRRKLETKFHYSTADSAEFIEMILQYAKLVQPKQKVEHILNDVDDHIILECALEAKAELIVTADRGLLKLKRFQATRIIHPSLLKYWFPYVDD